MGDLSARRGRIVAVNAQDHAEQITALVPLAELLRYATTLTAMTAGRGSYVMDFAHYDEVPTELTARVIERHKVEGQIATAH